MSSTTAWPTQLLLPGQAAAPEGPLDMWMMYVTHHAYRRDLAKFCAAAEATATEDRRTWRALLARWELFGLALHHHHHAEDAALWPLLMARADAAGQAVLRAMEAEHAEIDPILAAVTVGLTRLSRAADDDARAALLVRLVAGRESLGRHLAHEETEAIALMQELMTQPEWQQMQDDHFKPDKITWVMIKNVLPWTIDGVPAAVRERLLGDMPAGRLVWRLSRGGYARRERAAFGDAT